MHAKAALPQDLDIPSGTLRRVRLRMRHDAGTDAEDAVAKALAPLAGQGRVVHYQLVRRGISWNKTRWRMMASTNRRTLMLRSPQMRSGQVRALVDALAALPGARDVAIDART